jgi:AcrR family transcriptional regulator
VRSRLQKADPRSTKTRRTLLDAFFVVVLSTPYENITIDDIAKRACISRSTFYEHFAGKNALLAASLRAVFTPLADIVSVEDNLPQLTAVLEHFWANRALARSVLTGTTRPHTVEVLAKLVQNRLIRSGALLVPTRLAALQNAESLLSPITAWLLGEAQCPAARLARALRASGLGLVRALRA